MTQTSDITRPPRWLCDALANIGSATAAGELNQMGLRDTFIRGPVAHSPGRSIAGPALTLQFMPKREDIYGANEYDDPEAQLHRHVLYHTQEGDIVVVDARGDMTSGIFGSMMLSYFAGKGGKGVIIDGCIRDSTQCLALDLGFWVKGVTPNFHTQTNIIPFAVNVPIACGGALVFPGDIVVADDDGAVVVPAAMAEELVTRANHHVEWEEFTRMKLLQGADLRKYYPLREDARAEYEEWRAAQPQR